MVVPGAFPTPLSPLCQIHVNSACANAAKVREIAHDWDFTDDGRSSQCSGLNNIATFEAVRARTVICDFVCPTGETRKEFNADITIWMDTIEAGRFDDTNKIFEPPTDVDYHICGFQSDEEIVKFANGLKEMYQ